MNIPRWYRSWPSPTDWAEHDLDIRPHVVDTLPRLMMSGQNYRTVGEYRSIGTSDGWPIDRPGFCMLEYDVALDPVEMQLFASIALLEPQRILVAPYRFHDTWSSFQGNDGSGPSVTGRPIHVDEIEADSFGLGCIYIPRDILTEFLPTMDHLGFTDYTFGKWYHERYGKVRITWEVHPQHLHLYPDTFIEP